MLRVEKRPRVGQDIRMVKERDLTQGIKKSVDPVSPSELPHQYSLKVSHQGQLCYMNMCLEYNNNILGCSVFLLSTIL